MSPKDRDDRVTKFRDYVQSLNRQFLDWANKQWAQSPARFWSTGMQDYLRTVAKVRREFSDVLVEDDNNVGRGSGQGTPGSSTPPLAGPRGSGDGGRALTPRYEPQLSLTPFCNTKVIHFIRHGEGFHNVGYSNNLDARLTERGWEQAHALGRHFFSQTPTSGVQLVVVSPMARTLETAAGIFGVEPPQPAPGSPPPQLLMAAQDGSRKERTAHAALARRPDLKFVAMELCRERLGPSQCDRRQPLEDAQRQFPGVDFSLVESPLDALWEAGHAESESSVVVRGFNFLAWLMQRPETNIAVVTHSAFLWFTLACFGNEFAKPVRENLQRWYENCEMRTLVLSDGGGAGVPDRTWFPGGTAYQEPQKAILPDVEEQGKGTILSALQTAWQGGVPQPRSDAQRQKSGELQPKR